MKCVTNVTDASLPAPRTMASTLFLDSPQAHLVRTVREDLGEREGTSRAARSCVDFVSGVGLVLANPGLRVAAFWDEDVVSLVAHNRSARRQATFDFAPDGRTVTITQIDEEMRRTEQAASQHGSELLASLGWLIRTK